jgi:hypothetical protein
MKKLGDLQAFRNFVIIGTAIPESFKDVAKGADQLPRHGWLFYQALLSKMPAGMRRPNYGDYTIVHPEFTPVDKRNPSSDSDSCGCAPPPPMRRPRNARLAGAAGAAMRMSVSENRMVHRV